MCFDRACKKPEAMCLRVALRIELPEKVGVLFRGVKSSIMVLMWGITPPQALHPTPEEVHTGARDEETEEQQSSDVVIFCSGMWLFIVRSVEESGFVITVTFLKIVRHGKMSWGWITKNGQIVLWDMLEPLGLWNLDKQTNTYLPI